MKQIVLEEPGHFRSAEAAPPEARRHEALVRVRRVGVCGTDYHAFEGRQPYFTYPRILGHELAVERSEEHTSELQSRLHLVCRLLLEKKNVQNTLLNLPRISV